MIGSVRSLISHETASEKIQQIKDFGSVSAQKMSIVGPSPENTTEFGEYGSQDGSLKLGSVVSRYTNYYGFDINRTEQKMAISKWRQIAGGPEVADAVEEIVNEVIISNDENPNIVKLDYMDREMFTEELRSQLEEEFKYILKILKFRQNGKFLFKSFYIDGQLVLEKVFDVDFIHRGIIGINKLDSKNIIHVKEYENGEDGQRTLENEFFKYEIENNQFGTYQPNQQEYSFVSAFGSSQAIGETIVIKPELICKVDSGEYHDTKGYPMSYLSKAVKIANQLSLLEDSIVVYRMLRAPMRRAFSVEFGNTPSEKIKEELKELANAFKQDVTYDPTTGEWQAKDNIISLYDDIWLAKRNGASTTDIQQLEGANNLGDLADLTLFSKKIWTALNVPWYRRLAAKGEASPGGAHQSGKEITIEELKFQKFKKNLRERFNDLFLDLVKTQILVKEIVLQKDMDDVLDNLKFVYNDENYFDHMLELSVLSDEIDVAKKIKEDLTPFFSDPYIAKRIFRRTSENNDDMKDERLHPEDYGFDKLPFNAGGEGGGMGGGGDFGGGDLGGGDMGGMPEGEPETEQGQQEPTGEEAAAPEGEAAAPEGEGALADFINQGIEEPE